MLTVRATLPIIVNGNMIATHVWFDLAERWQCRKGWETNRELARNTFHPPSMPLNNDGDEVLLIDSGGTAVWRVVYGDSQVWAGEWIRIWDINNRQPASERDQMLTHDMIQVLRSINKQVADWHRAPLRIASPG